MCRAHSTRTVANDRPSTPTRKEGGKPKIHHGRDGGPLSSLGVAPLERASSLEPLETCIAQHLSDDGCPVLPPSRLALLDLVELAALVWVAAVLVRASLRAAGPIRRHGGSRATPPTSSTHDARLSGVNTTAQMEFQQSWRAMGACCCAAT